MNTFRKLTAFFIPLAIQGMSMSLTYPLVGSVVSHGTYGPDEYAVFAQAQVVMFLVGSIGTGLVTTGLVFAQSKTGLNNYMRLVFLLGGTAAAMQLICCLPPFDSIIFGRLYHLEGGLFNVGRYVLLACIPLNFLFITRSPALMILFKEKRSDKATFATFFRIGLTWIGSVLFVKLGWVGWINGAILSTVTVLIESSLFYCFAKPFMNRIVDTKDNEKASVWHQCRFTIPLSLGGTMLHISALMIGIFLSLTDNPEVSRAIHYIAMGIVNPLGAATLRMQTVTITFPPKEYGFGRIQIFAIAAGFLVSTISMLLQIPAIARWYFCDVQNLQPDQVRMAMTVVLIVAFTPLIQCLRGHAEGLAALRRRPNATLSGNIGYLATLVTVFFLLVHFHVVPGYMSGAISIVLSQIAAFVIIRLALLNNDFADEYNVTHTN